ncbi:MAG: S8 family serine peptidase, partial [bacterium]
AAGNDRSDNAPSSGTLVYYAGANFYKTYIPATDPYSDGYDNGGFDTIGGDGTAKNILTVGAVNDAVSVGVRSVAAATMSSFSCWGPADDGRIKPDVVGNGVNLCSSLGSGDTSYGWMSGTSMATPNVCGSAVLLTDYYGVLFPGQYMRASTLKGLIIHTADDLGNAGPDYKYGWGLMNTKAAADLIKSHHDVPSGLHLMELSVDAVATCRTNTFAWDGTSPIRATLCWTDPAGPVRSGLDNTNRVLVNDLDLLIVGPAGQVYFPYVLALTNPAAAATTGTNRVDNVEQVYIASPGSAGAYRVVVSLHGELSGPSQEYSVLLSGSAASPTSPPVIVADSPLPSGRVGAAYLQNLTAIGGTTPYVWSTPAGTLPSGLSLGSGGGLSGTPNATTSANFRVRVTGGNGVYAEVAFRLGIDSLLFSEGFENGGVMPAGWTQAYVTDTVDWVFQSGGYNYKDILHPASAHGGSYNAFLSVDAYNDHKTRLVTPMINLGANAQNAQLTFWHNMEIWGTDQDELRVFYQTSSGGSWMLLATYTNSVASWTQRTLALSGATNTCAIAFEGNVKWGYGVSLDDVAITTTPPPTQTSWGTPYAWLNQHGLATGGDYEAAAAADQDGDGYAAWQEYVAGTEPTNYSSVFLAGIAMSNALPQVIWMPDLGMARVYTVEGLTNLLGSGWGATNSDSRFFRVNVALP